MQLNVPGAGRASHLIDGDDVFDLEALRSMAGLAPTQLDTEDQAATLVDDDSDATPAPSDVTGHRVLSDSPNGSAAPTEAGDLPDLAEEAQPQDDCG
eukprot:11639465-Karenia_brevis.AAC.1